MRKILVLLWLLLPLPVVVLHYGRGQQWLARDHAGDFIKQAQAAEQVGDWKKADECYQSADKAVGTADRGLKLRLELARVRSRFHLGEAVAAIDGVDRLLDDAAMATMPLAFQNEARELAGRIHYYAGWVMRLEGAKRELWLEEAELSRQNYRLLSEQSSGENSAQAVKQHEDLEAAVQLQRLSFTELIARPLPREGQCMSGQGLSEQMGKRRGNRGKKPGKTGGGKPAKGGGLERFEPGSGS
jgi:hypothetical protein